MNRNVFPILVAGLMSVGFGPAQAQAQEQNQIEQDNQTRIEQEYQTDFENMQVELQPTSLQDPDYGRGPMDRDRDHGGWDRGGRDHGGWDRGGRDHGGWDHGGRGHEGWDHGRYPGPGYGRGYRPVTCFAENGRGQLFSGTASDTGTASEIALNRCSSVSRYCRSRGCRY
jgi:hypothetical protein